MRKIACSLIEQLNKTHYNYLIKQRINYQKVSLAEYIFHLQSPEVEGQFYLHQPNYTHIPHLTTLTQTQLYSNQGGIITRILASRMQRSSQSLGEVSAKITLLRKTNRSLTLFQAKCLAKPCKMRRSQILYTTLLLIPLYLIKASLLHRRV